MTEPDPLGGGIPQARVDDLSALGQTPWQTVGPFFHYGLAWKGGADLVGQSELGARPDLFPPDHYVLNIASPKGAVRGERVEVRGVVYDAHGQAVPDAMIEVWQANSVGRYHSPDDRREELELDEGFVGWGRSSTTSEGGYRFVTIKPGRVPGPGDTLQAPHIAVGVFGRGLLKRLVTRIYFEDEVANGRDAILERVPEVRRETLIARRCAAGVYRFDVHLQGEHETVFFDI